MITILVIASISFWFTNLTNIPQTIQYKLKLNSIKPFDCALCFSFWLSIGYMASTEGWISALISAPLASFLAVIIEKTYYKIFGKYGG